MTVQGELPRERYERWETSNHWVEVAGYGKIWACKLKLLADRDLAFRQALLNSNKELHDIVFGGVA